MCLGIFTPYFDIHVLGQALFLGPFLRGKAGPPMHRRATRPFSLTVFLVLLLCSLVDLFDLTAFGAFPFVVFRVICLLLLPCAAVRAMPVEVTPFCWEHTLNTIKSLPSIKVRTLYTSSCVPFWDVSRRPPPVTRILMTLVFRGVLPETSKFYGENKKVHVSAKTKVHVL